jgi:hypothetical protein
VLLTKGDYPLPTPLLLAILAILLPLSVSAQTIETVARPIVFPTEKTATFQDDFGDARSGHLHEANDLMGPKMTPLYAAVSGRVRSINDPEESWGYAVTISDADGWTYHYLHINDDTPGTDDGNGGTEHAYAPGIFRGATVTKGQLIGWMGDSGNAENAGSHLHFEIRMPDGTAINPFASLTAALNRTAMYDFVPATVMVASPDINTDKGYLADPGVTPPCISGSLVKSSSTSAVYYCGADSKRHAFPNDRVYFTWYENFDDVTTISEQALAAIPLGKNVTYRPGVRMVKIESVPNVYAIDKNGMLRWIPSPSIATALYGKDWAKNVDDLSISFFTNYTEGEPVREVE